ANQQVRTVSPIEVRRQLLEDAVAFYTQLLKLNPTDAQAYVERGQIRRLLGQRDLSRADFEKALELQPEQTEYNNPPVSGTPRHCAAAVRCNAAPPGQTPSPPPAGS